MLPLVYYTNSMSWQVATCKADLRRGNRWKLLVRLWLKKLLGTNLVVFLITTKNVTVEQNMTMAVSLLKFSIVCGETTEPELNPTMTKLVTKLVST